MGLLSKIFKPQSAEHQKMKIFNKFEKQYNGSDEMIQYCKAQWLNSRAIYYGTNGDYDLAINDSIEAIKLKNDFIPAYITTSIACREKGMFENALEILNKAPHEMIIFQKTIKGFEFDLYNTYVSLYLLMDDKSKAVKYAKMALNHANDPEYEKQREFAIHAGIIDKIQSDNSELITMLKELVYEFRFYENPFDDDDIPF